MLVEHRVKAKFVAVGMLNTIVGYLVFFSLDTLFSHIFQARYAAYMTAMIVTEIVSVTMAYVSHKFITFKSIAAEQGILRELLKFCGTYLGVFVFSLAFLPFCVEVCHIHPKVAAGLLIPIRVLISYIGHSRYSFKNLGS